MPIPDDMQHVGVILFRDDVEQLDSLVRKHGYRSRSLLMRALIERGIELFFTPKCSVNSTSTLAEVHHDDQRPAA